MTWPTLALVHNIKFDAVLRLPLHVAEEALIDQHLEGADDAGGQDQDEVVLSGSKAVQAHRSAFSWTPTCMSDVKGKGATGSKCMRTAYDSINTTAASMLSMLTCCN